MSKIALPVLMFLFLGATLMGISGCAGINVQSPSQEVKTFFLAGNKANYLGLQCPSATYVDLSAYSHLMGITYPPTRKVDVLSQPPSRPYQSFAVLEYGPSPSSKPQEVVEEFKNKAMQIGADAIILCHAGMDQGLPGMPPTSNMQVVAIKYKLTSRSDQGNNP